MTYKTYAVSRWIGSGTELEPFRSKLSDDLLTHIWTETPSWIIEDITGTSAANITPDPNGVVLSLCNVSENVKAFVDSLPDCLVVDWEIEEEINAAKG